MKQICFSPDISVLAEIRNTFAVSDLQSKMVYGASVHFMLNKFNDPLGKSITAYLRTNQRFQDDLVRWAVKGYHPVIDTKVVQLMPGQYPCIPGWHCDGVIRNDRNSQPDLNTLYDHVPHYIFSTSDVPEDQYCPTELINQDVYVDECAINPESVWGSVNSCVIGLEKNLDILRTQKDKIYRFTRPTLHRGAQAKYRQWRYFYRLSFYHMPTLNQRRTQVQVYADPNGGW